MTPHAQRFRLLIPLTAAIVLSACSWESVQRSSYETLESMSQQQCMDQPDAACPTGRTSYDDYQSERERLQEQER